VLVEEMSSRQAQLGGLCCPSPGAHLKVPSLKTKLPARLLAHLGFERGFGTSYGVSAKAQPQRILRSQGGIPDPKHPQKGQVSECQRWLLAAGGTWRTARDGTRWRGPPGLASTLYY